MGQLIEHAMLNKLDDALNEAITNVGGDSSKASSLMDYPDIISKQLTTDPRGIDGRIVGDETIKVQDTPIGYALSAIGTADAKLTRDIKISDKKQINKGETIQDVFTYLFANVLPNINQVTEDTKNSVAEEFENIKESLKELDIDIQVIISSHDGQDNYSVNDMPRVRCDLEPFTYYLRVRKSNNTEATYISLSNLIQLSSDVLLSDENSFVHYDILGYEFKKKVERPNAYYLAIGIGKLAHPSLFIDLRKINLEPAKDSITSEKIKAESITAEKIKAGSITADKIESGSVTADKLEENSITEEKIKAESVTTDKIKDSSVTVDKLDEPTKSTIEKVPEIHKEVEKQKETITIVEKTLEETITNEEAELLVKNIFK